MYAKLKKEGRINKHPVHGHKLADNMIIKIHSTLHLAMETAIEKNLIAKNPTEGTTVPKKKKKDLKVLNDSELDKLMQALNDDKEWGDFFYLELTTGLRRGEICGLKWENFDEEQNKLYIRTNIYRDNGELKEGKPKTNEGERCIILPKATADMLKRRKRISKWMFPNLTTPELPIAPEAAYRKAKLMLKGLNLPNISFHDLRHPYVKLKLKFLLTQHYRCIGAKVLDFPLNFKPVVGVNIHFVYEHICECLCQGVFLFHCFCCLQSF